MARFPISLCLITRSDNTQIVGRIIEKKSDKWMVATSPFDFSQLTELDPRDVKPSPASPMPPGAIYQLNPDELKDPLTYLLGK